MKGHATAHQDYLNLIAEQERAEKLEDYRNRLGVTDASANLDDLLKIAASQRSKEHNNSTNGVKTMSNVLGEMIQTASSKAAYSEVIEQEETYRRRMPQSQSDIRFLNLRDLQIKETLNFSSVPALAPAGSPGIISQIAPLTIAGNSRVVQAGANLMLVSQDAKPFDGKDRTGYFWESETVFIQSEPAKFQPVQEGQPAPESESPVHYEILYRLAVKQFMFSTNISRRRAERFFAGQMEEALLRSIALGIADAVDSALLNRIKISGYADPFVANTGLPIGSFSLAKVSARGLRFSDLSAIIGSAATGASINANGELTANGIKAEFSNAISETIIGKFSACAATIGDQITLIANRSGAQALDGSMQVTCICEIGTMIPVNGLALHFWKFEA